MSEAPDVLSQNRRSPRVDDGQLPLLAVDLDNRGGGPSDLSAEETQGAHERRLEYLAAKGWHLTEEGLVKDVSDLRSSKTDRILIPYLEGLAFEEGVRSAYRRQKMLEAERLAAEQRRSQR